MTWSNKVATWKYTLIHDGKKEVIKGNFNLKGTYQGKGSRFHVSFIFGDDLKKLNSKLHNENLYFLDTTGWQHDLTYSKFDEKSNWYEGNKIIKSIYLLMHRNMPRSSGIGFNYEYRLCKSLNSNWNHEADDILKHMRKVNRAKHAVFKRNGEILDVVGEYYIRVNVKKEDIYIIAI